MYETVGERAGGERRADGRELTDGVVGDDERPRAGRRRRGRFNVAGALRGFSVAGS